ncbi:MAG: hypothetical protein SFT94_13135 [Pseudanabaenaceae cyanobacterium bins.68]|nr:hypothetical protein [Pseudanabaenaceae cyanobacterium bins.68]
MSKYTEIYQLFAQDLQNHQAAAEACLIFGDRCIGEMLKYLEWREEDAHLVMLPHHHQMPQARSRRVSILESNLAKLEKVTYLVSGYWCFGLRLSLIWRTSSPARYPEVSFIVPFYIRFDQDFILKPHPQAQPIEHRPQFYDAVVGQIKTHLFLGSQAHLDRIETNPLDREFGIILFGSGF